jgi:hypothetical protein
MGLRKPALEGLEVSLTVWFAICFGPVSIRGGRGYGRVVRADTPVLSPAVRCVPPFPVMARGA